MIKKRALLILILVLLAACAGNNPTQEATSALPPTGQTSRTPQPTPTLVRSQATATGATQAPTAPPPSPAAVATTAPPTPLPAATASPTPSALTFAVIGDYGLAGPPEATVAALVDSWDPELILTTGDNNYPNGEAETIDQNIGQYYAEYIYPYTGHYTNTASVVAENRFFPTLGNHDYYSSTGAQPYLTYFTLPGNERYYHFVRGPVHFFALNSDFNEPDGVGATSAQAQWLQAQLAGATQPWKIVYMHVPPYSSGYHGSGAWMRWPFAQWGATAVISGHDHHYERLLVDGIPYFVNGLGGGALYSLGEPLAGSEARFTGEHGAMRVEASATELTFEFVTAGGQLVDSYTITR